MKKNLCALAIIIVLVCVFTACNIVETPIVSISEDGYWVINGEKTEVKAKGENSTATNENPQGLAFCLKDDGTYAVEIGYAKYLSKIEIPDTYNGKAVTEVGRFSDDHGNAVLKEITIPDSVTTIGDYAFYNCANLTSVTIPDSVTTIGDLAFYGCNNLTTVTMPTIAISAISKTNLTTIVLTGGTAIDDFAFYDCDGLTSVTIGDSVTTIGDSAFRRCSNLTSVTIGGSVTTIGNFAFAGCSNFTDVYYTGSKVDWEKITIGYNNYYLIGANRHYNYVPEE